MCGIAGLFRYEAPDAVRRSLVERMSAVLRHRGPDDSGSYVDERIALGMRRLSVIDLPGGHQPMTTEDGLVHIVFNGEIYNFADIRRHLAATGECFQTHSDTEVILRHYRRNGLAGFDALNGMFAVALWDRRSRELHLVRDRLGVKPLYYFWDGRTFAFASEIKALLELPMVERQIDPRAIWDYLTFRYVPAPNTSWRHVYKLPPGHRLTIGADEGEPRVERWWEIPRPVALSSRSDAELTAQFSELFVDAVKRRMIADVPVGILLSGGIDSSAVAAVAVESHGSNLKTFSVSFVDSLATDERSYARAVARHLGTDHEEIEIGEREFMDLLPEFVRYTDEPLADLASMPLFFVCQLARRRVTVALSGEGADEILAGYDFDRWWTSRMAAGREHTDLGDDPVPPHMTNYTDSAAKQALFREPIAERDSADVLRQHVRRAAGQHPLNQMLYLYSQDWLAEDLLMKADRMSMANSLELRTPFLDYRLVEWAAQAPICAKVGRDGDGQWWTKRVLRLFAADRLPPEIIRRPKRGFPVPVYDWLAGSLKTFARDLLLSHDARLGRWFRSEVIRTYVDRGTSVEAATHDRHRLWHLIVLEYWMRAWSA
jgi:asparagine synthase (glutamine-hydrolysing)